MSEITVYRARKVIAMDAGRPFAQCVAVMDGRVLSTGTIETMQPCSGAIRTASTTPSSTRSSCRG